MAHLVAVELEDRAMDAACAGRGQAGREGRAAMSAQEARAMAPSSPATPPKRTRMHRTVGGNESVLERNVGSARPILAFTIPGRPVSWSRTYNVGTGRSGDRKQMRIEAARKAAIQWAAKAAVGRASWALSGDFAVDIVSYYPTRVVGDVDRAAGLVLDALQCPRRCKYGHMGICWHDDRQVRDLRVRIVMSDPNPRTVVTVTRLEGM
jgi:Holliday junction resolvase RusA-like endonuclease